MKLVLASCVSLLLGLGLGWLAFHETPAVQTIEQQVVQQQPAVERVRVIEGTAPVVAPAVAPTVAPVATPNSGRPAEVIAQRDEELERLRARVAQLESTLESELKLKRANEGAPISPPANLPERLRDEKQLVAAFNKAFKEAGFDKAQVSSVDCSEYPCIVFGSGFGERDDMSKLIKTGALADYAEDQTHTWGFARESDPATRFFGVALTPQGERNEALEKRVDFRVRQMEEVSRPPKKP
ncbi:MAG: hypothetical protein QM817_00595 [Archangium sp.]